MHLPKKMLILSHAFQKKTVNTSDLCSHLCSNNLRTLNTDDFLFPPDFLVKTRQLFRLSCVHEASTW